METMVPRGSVAEVPVPRGFGRDAPRPGSLPEGLAGWTWRRRTQKNCSRGKIPLRESASSGNL